MIASIAYTVSDVTDISAIIVQVVTGGAVAVVVAVMATTFIVQWIRRKL